MPKIDTSAIPGVELKNLCRTFCNAIVKTTEDKAFHEKYAEHIKAGTKGAKQPKSRATQ